MGSLSINMESYSADCSGDLVSQQQMHKSPGRLRILVDPEIPNI